MLWTAQLGQQPYALVLLLVAWHESDCLCHPARSLCAQDVGVQAQDEIEAAEAERAAALMPKIVRDTALCHCPVAAGVLLLWLLLLLRFVRRRYCLRTYYLQNQKAR